MRVKIKLEVNRTGTVTIKTVENAGEHCRAVTDAMAAVLGKADESSRADTEDLYVRQTNDTHVESDT